MSIFEKSQVFYRIVCLLAKNEDTDLYLIEKPEHTFKYTLNTKWEAFGLVHKGKYISFYYSDSANTIEIAGRYVGDISLEHTWKDWVVYMLEFSKNSLRKSLSIGTKVAVQHSCSVISNS